jgi:outer membrane protein
VIAQRLTLFALALAAPFAAPAQTASKVGIIHIQNAILSTKDGQKAASDLTARFDPKSKELEKKRNDIAALQQELSKGSNTMAEERRLQLTREIDQKTKSLQRDSEDAQAEFEQDQGRILNELGQRLLAVIDKYARDNGFTLVLDVSSPQTPVLFASNETDITKAIIDLYDKNAPGASGAAPAPTKPAPAAPPAKK